MLVSCKLDTSSDSSSSFLLSNTKSLKALKEGDEKVETSDRRPVAASALVGFCDRSTAPAAADDSLLVIGRVYSVLGVLFVVRHEI